MGVLRQLDEDEDKARQQYSRFIQDGLADGQRKEFQHGSFQGRVLGHDRFIEQVLSRAEQDYARPVTMAHLLAVVCEDFEISLEALSAPAEASRLLKPVR